MKTRKNTKNINRCGKTHIISKRIDLGSTVCYCKKCERIILIARNGSRAVRDFAVKVHIHGKSIDHPPKTIRLWGARNAMDLVVNAAEQRKLLLRDGP